MLEAMDEGVLILDLDSNVVHCNERANDITALPLDERLRLTPEEIAARLIREDGTPHRVDTLPAYVALRSGKREVAGTASPCPMGERAGSRRPLLRFAPMATAR